MLPSILTGKLSLPVLTTWVYYRRDSRIPTPAKICFWVGGSNIFFGFWRLFCFFPPIFLWQAFQCLILCTFICYFRGSDCIPWCQIFYVEFFNADNPALALKLICTNLHVDQNLWATLEAICFPFETWKLQQDIIFALFYMVFRSGHFHSQTPWVFLFKEQ